MTVVQREGWENAAHTPQRAHPGPEVLASSKPGCRANDTIKSDIGIIGLLV